MDIKLLQLGSHYLYTCLICVVTQLSISFRAVFNWVSGVKPKPNQLQWPIKTIVDNAMSQWELEANTRNRAKRGKTRITKSRLVFGFASDWLSWWREFFKPITEHSKAKPKQFRITFDTQLKIALSAISRYLEPKPLVSLGLLLCRNLQGAISRLLGQFFLSILTGFSD